jgi:AcrR family transcriptional regulator
VALLRKRGIQASSLADVMKGAGLTVGGFYAHFDSKEQLFAEAIQRAASTMWELLLASARGDSAMGIERSAVALEGRAARSNLAGTMRVGHRGMVVASIISPSIPLSLPRQALDTYHEGVRGRPPARVRRHASDGT